MTTPNDEDIPKAVPGTISLAGADRPDITRFLNVRSASSPSLSPDGRQVAFRTTVTGTPQLWVVDAEGGWPEQLTFGESVTFHAWSPRGDGILYGTDRGGNEREGYYLIAPDGTTERELLAPSESFRVFGGFTRDGSRIAYAASVGTDARFAIHLLDIDNGRDVEVFEGRPGLYVAAWRPDASAVLLTQARGEDANDVYLLDLDDGSLTTLFQPEDRSRYGSFAWNPDGSGFYLATDQNTDRSALAYYDLQSSSLTTLDQPDGDVEQVALSRDGRYLCWVINDRGYARLETCRILTQGSLDGTHLGPPTGLPEGVLSVTWASSAPVLAIQASGPRVPGDIWVWDVEADRLTRATTSSAAGLDLDKMVVPRPLAFPSRDGTTIHGLYYEPRRLGGQGGPPPVLLAVHGGPTAQARPRFQATHQYLLTRGIAVFDLNYRGSTGYGKVYARLNDGRLRATEYLDMADAIAYLGAEELADPDRAAVMGGSYGGYLTMAAVTRLPDVFRAGVAFVGVSNWITALQGASPQLKASDRIEYGDIDDPEDRAFFEAISPIRHVGDDVAPVMVLHGANDPRDPVDESDQFVGAIRERGGTVEYLRFPDEGHGIRKRSNRIIAYRRIDEFLRRYLLSDEAL